MAEDPANLPTETPASAPPGAADGPDFRGPDFRGPGVDTGDAPGGALPGVLRFFVVPLALVAASLAVFAGLGALVGQGPPSPADLVRTIAEGGKNARWQAAQDLSNQVYRGDVDLKRDERLARSLGDAFEKARLAGDDIRVLEHLAVLLGRADPKVTGPVLRGALADGNPDVRIFVIGALAQQGQAGDVELLLARLDDLDPSVRAVAAYAAAGLIARGNVQLVLVGADRIAANGDFANKVGTYGLALACSAHRVPFFAVAPASTFDLRLPDGARIPIEERDGTEVTMLGGAPVAPAGVRARNPAFDVTPARLLTGIVTDRGVLRAPFEAAIKAMFQPGR